MKIILLAIACSLCVIRTGYTAVSVDEQVIEIRAVQAVIWAMPAVNYDRMLQAMVKAGGQENQIVYWSKLFDWKNQTLTPNPNTIYLMPFMNTKDTGPLVLEIPAASEGQEITGTVTDAWQVALEDVGPAGADKGEGGKYLILPPDYAGNIPSGYIVLRSSTHMSSALLRSSIGNGSDTDIAKAVAYGKRIKVYPLSKASNPPATTFVDALGTTFDSTIPYDIRFFESLDRFVQKEPWQERDKAMIDQLKSIGIEQGKPFKPDTERQRVLEQAAVSAASWLDKHYEALFSPYYPGGQWALPLAHELTEGLANSFSTPGVYPVDTRGVFFSFAFSSVKKLGTGQFYLVALRDKTGAPFDGDSTYRLTVPAKAPVRLYWSATVYDRSTHTLIQDQKWPSRGSMTPGLQTNADGSVDLYFGPKPPDGKESSWIPTQAGRGWEVMMRFYGPQPPLFDKSWVLPDLEKIPVQ